MTIMSQIELLENAGLITQTTLMSEMGYTFRHSLLHDAAYQSLLRQDRRKLHLVVAHMIEHLHKTRLDEFAPVLAQHYLEGGNDDLALRYFQQSADHAANVYANAEACMHYAQAIQIAKRIQSPANTITDLYAHYGRVLELRNKYADALALYAELQQAGEINSDEKMQLIALVLQATIQGTPTAQFNPAVSLALSQQALLLTRKLHDKATEARVLWNLMHVNHFTGHIPEAINYGEQSLALARQLNLREQLAYTLNDLYTSLAATGQTDRARQALVESRELWRELGNLPMLSDNLNSSAELLYLVGQLSPALVLLDESLSISHRIMNTWGLAYGSMIKGFILCDLGQVDEGINVLHDAAQLGDQSGFVVAQIYVRLILAFIFGDLGLFDRAFSYYNHAIDIARAKVPSWEGIGSSVLALLHCWQGDKQKALAALDAAHTWVQTQGEVIPFDSTTINYAQSIVSLKQMEYETALRYADIYLRDATRNGLNFFYSDCLLARGKALYALLRLPEAREALIEAISSAHSRECHRIMHHMLITLSSVEAALGNLDESSRIQAEAAEAVRMILNNMHSEYLRDAFSNTAEALTLLQD